MTTYQEPPLHSRRAARQEERADAPFVVPGAVTPTPDEQATGEPLNYATSSRPPLPHYDGQGLRPRRSADAVEQGELAQPEPLPRQDVPASRARDFSPEGRRAMAPGGEPLRSAASEAEPATPTDSASVTPSASVIPSEHTMTRRELRALREAGLIPDDAIVSLETGTVVPPAPAVPAPVAPAPTAHVVDTPPPLIEPAPASTSQSPSRLNSALAEFDVLAAGREPIVAAPDAPAPLPGRRAAQPIEPAVDAVSAPEAVAAPEAVPAAPAFVAAAPVDLPEIVIEADAEPEAEASTVAVVESAIAADGLSAFDALFQDPSAQPPAPMAPPQFEAPTPTAFAPPPPGFTPATLLAPPSGPAVVPPPSYPATVHPVTDLSAPPATSAPSVGHWSTQSDLDDAEQINESTISRSVGSGAITTSALVLPSVPEHTIGGPISTSGEILLTGSISLPQSLAVSGAHPSQLDESDIDHLLDPGDHQVASTDSTPVRAIRAVSTHTATGGIIAPAKPKGTRGFTILIIAASSLALVVVGLLVVGLVSGTL